jgi:CRP-like cAMP-binding protein
MSEHNSGEIKVYEAGKELFHQGDPGGDLFFIREGKLDVVLEQDGQSLPLAQLGPGEILGLLTCVDHSKRTSSARAVTEVVGLFVKFEIILSLLSKCPDWLKSIIKELTTRVLQMNEKYAQSLLVIRKLKATQVNTLFIGAQVASALPVIAPLVSMSVEKKSFLLVEETLEKLEQILARPKSEIESILEVFQTAGLIKIEIEPEKKRRVVDLEIAKRVAPFASFVAQSNAGKTKKIVMARLSPKEYRYLRALLPVAKAGGIEPKGLIRLPVQTCHEKFEMVTKVAFDPMALGRAVALGIIELNGDWSTGTLEFAPTDMLRTVVFAETFGRLEALASAAPQKEKKAA